MTNKSFVLFSVIFLPVSLLIFFLADTAKHSLACYLPNDYQAAFRCTVVLSGYVLVTLLAFFLLRSVLKKELEEIKRK